MPRQTATVRESLTTANTRPAKDDHDVSDGSDILHLPVQDHPTEPAQTWPTLAAALDSAQSGAGGAARTPCPV